MSWSINIGSGASRAGRNPAKAGGGCLIAFGLVFAGIGSLFTVFLARQLLAEAATRQWPEALCQLRSCEIEIDAKRDDPFRLAVAYSYEFEGRAHESDRLSLNQGWSDDYEKLALIRRDLMSRDGLVCRVNPENPAEAVLRSESLAMGFFLLIPLVFVAVGLGIVWGGVVMLRARRRGSIGAKAAAVGGRAGQRSGKGAILVMGILFSLVGGGVAAGLVAGPLRNMVVSRDWVETPCTVIWSRVLSHRSDDGTTYSVDIFYEYEFAGQVHRSNRYQFFGGSSSGRSGKVAVTRNYPEGSRQVCFVNPDLPEQAVLKPGLNAMVFIAAIPLVFLIIGLALIAGALRSGRARATSRTAPTGSATLLAGPSPETLASGAPLVLTSGGSRLAKAGFLLVFTLFWNGIVSVFVADAVEGWKNGSGDIFLTLFMIPFVLIGIGTFLGFLYLLMALANPKATLTLPSGNPRLGEPFEVTWEFSGRISRVTRLKISLWGVESATYRRGTDSSTSREVFLDLTLAEPVAESEIRRGRATVTVPGDLIPTLELPNNSIKYELKVRGEVPLWPDIDDSFDLTLLTRRPDPV